MSRRRSELRDQAYLMWEKSDRRMLLVEIARKLNLAPSLIRKWKHEDAWEARPRRKRGGQPGNKNAVGNKGGGAPPGNKNGWKNGMYESMWMSQIAIEHKLKLMKTETNPRQILVNEIFLLEYREFKLMGYIKQIEEGWDASSVSSKMERFKKTVEDMGDTPAFVDGFLQVELKVDYEMIETETITKTPQKLERLLAIENALSTVQGRKLRCIALLDQFDRNELTDEELRLKVERMQLEVNKLRAEAW
ncbi:MAG: phage terminase small subunit [Paenibacillus sp.]|uniref:phage terminase small subunit n=1 Tax=Paenibacillus sp. TaxID=58172 RepID=UPI0029125534|nr:phage terminase small subunit [Paenibacillus sp.]MDU4696407.1 phage terminase small subunit [Paenibacillus sp.]